MWHRLPASFPNFPLRMLPLGQEALKQLREHGWLREVAFRTQPKVTKLEIKSFIESAYGMQVERVNTMNYLGKKKTQYDRKGRPFYFRLSDWKKAYVVFKAPQELLPKLNPGEAARQQELEQLRQERAASLAAREEKSKRGRDHRLAHLAARLARRRRHWLRLQQGQGVAPAGAGSAAAVASAGGHSSTASRGGAVRS